MPKNRVHTYLGAGAVFGTGENFQLKPSFMIRKIKGIPTNTDLTGILRWQNTFDVGISFRSNSALSLLAVISLENLISVMLMKLQLMVVFLS